MAARAGVEPTTLRLRVIDLTSMPLRPTNVMKQAANASILAYCLSAEVYLLCFASIVANHVQTVISAIF